MVKVVSSCCRQYDSLVNDSDSLVSFFLSYYVASVGCSNRFSAGVVGGISPFISGSAVGA